MKRENPIITVLKVLSLPFVPFIMVWVKLYSFIAYMLTTLAHMLTLGKYPVSRNPVYVLLALPVIQIMLIPGIILLMVKGMPKEEALAKQVENRFDKYDQTQSTQSNYIILQ